MAMTDEVSGSRRFAWGMLAGYATCGTNVAIYGPEHLVAGIALVVLLGILVMRTEWATALFERQDAYARDRRRRRARNNRT